MPDFSVNVFEALRRIGSKAPFRFPLLDTYLPTVQFFDLSDLVSAPLAPRGICGANISAGAGSRATFELSSRAPGGLIVEAIMADALVATEWRIAIDVLPVTPSLALASVLNIGGGEVASTFRASATATQISGNVRIPAPGYFNVSGQKWIVAGGSHLKFQKEALGGEATVSFIFREQPAAFEEP